MQAKLSISYNQRVKTYQQTIVRALASATLVVLIVLLYVKLLHVNPTTTALTFLLAILAVAAAWGLRYAIPMSIASAFCFNFFFLPPVGTLPLRTRKTGWRFSHSFSHR